MKKIIHILCVSLFFNVYKTQANTVTPQKAQEIAQAFFYSKEPSGANYRNKSLQLVYTEQLNNSFSSDPAYYIFNDTDGKGFVIISGDDSLEPILGYSLENTTDPNNIPPSFLFWMSRYKKNIEYNRTSNNFVENNEISAKWNTSYYQKRDFTAVKSVKPLLETTWGQGKYYNKFCPKISGVRTVTGCVATAMGQVMNYWEHPSGRGDGCRGDMNFYRESYDWRNMAKELNKDSTLDQDRAVAELLYHCGRSVDMDYGVNGSSAHTEDVVHALKEYFRYSDSVKEISQDDMSYSLWLNYLKAQLDKKQPMIMSGSKDKGGGHAWVCDGYVSKTRFHMDWGWRGKYNGDYHYNNLTPSDKNYNHKTAVIINIIPKMRNYGGSEDYTSENEEQFTAENEEQLYSSKEDQLGFEIELFPNPIVNFLYIKSDEALKQIECYSINGKAFDLHLKQDKVSMKHLPSGVYFVKVTNEKGITTTKKIIKQ